MPAKIPLCYDVLTQDANGNFSCSIPWVFVDYEPLNFHSLVDLLTFSFETCAQLVGGCAVLFVMGYSFGFVARMLTRR